MGIIDKNWIDAHDNALVAKLKPLSDAQIVRDWETIPGENTLLYDLGTELSHDYHSFKIGDELRVANQEAENGYDYYKLVNIAGTSPNLTALWIKEGEGGGDYKGSITINLITLVSTGSDPVIVSNTDLNGAIVTLTADNESVPSQTWNGTSLVFKNLAPLKTYSISVTAGTSQMSKYLAPTSIPSVESLGIGARVTRDINYTADLYSISIDSDQDDKTAIANAKVIYDNTNYSNGDSFKVPHGTTLTLGTDVTATEIEEYKCSLTLSGNTITAMYELVVDQVDLGLPSGLLWAAGNIVSDGNGGYKVGEETDFGAYFSWGNIVPHFSANGSTFDDSYDFGTSNSGPYASTPGASVGANIPTNDAQHDAALALLGSPWHLPTKDDFQELYDNTDNEWVADFNGTGVAGRKFMKKTDHSVYVFFPAAGFCRGTSLSSRGSSGFYWSGSWNSADSAYNGYFNSSSVNPARNSLRYNGNSVRAVQNSHKNITITVIGEEGVTLTLTDSEGTEKTAVTNASGVANFTQVAFGECSLSATDKALSATSITVNAETSEFSVAVLDVSDDDYIDLGLPSGLKWAKGNLVKNNSVYSIGSQTDYGTYVSWGNIVGHNNGEGYDFGTNNSGPYASTPGKQVSANIASNDAQHDAALALLGSPWRLPTKEEFQELYDNTDREWTAINGINGWKFMKKSDHSVFVFFPAAGNGYGTSINSVGSGGYCWSSSWGSANNAYGMYFSSSSVYPQNNLNRYFGFSVRPVTTEPVIDLHTDITITLNPTDEGSVNNIQVTVTDSEGTVHTATTDSNGVASFTNVALGNASVKAQGKGLSSNTINVSVVTFTLDCMDLEPITGYIINQSNPNAACADMIEMPTVNGVEVAAKDSDDVNSVIHRIWSNTKLYAAATSLSSGKLLIKEVSRTNKTKWADGTTISGTYDYFMKLPEFWWSCSEVSANTDRWNIQFSMEEQTGWNHWEGNTFIGIYKGYISGSSLYSRRGVTPTGNISWTTFTTDARNRGTGYSLITYEAHIIMALLGWGWLGTTDDLAIVGRGSFKYPKTTGLCDAKGITDTVAGVDGGAADGSTSGDVSINFWGLENFWGDIYEWVDNLKTANSSYLINVLDTNLSTVKRTVQSGATSSSYYGCIGKMVLGNNGDMIPKSYYSNSNYNTGFGASGSVNSSAGYVAFRSDYGSEANGGLGYLYVYYSTSYAGSSVGSRLLYKGDYIETALS